MLYCRNDCLLHKDLLLTVYVKKECKRWVAVCSYYLSTNRTKHKKLFLVGYIIYIEIISDTANVRIYDLYLPNIFF